MSHECKLPEIAKLGDKFACECGAEYEFTADYGWEQTVFVEPEDAQ